MYEATFALLHENNLISMAIVCRKALFDAPLEDPNYQPLPEEDRPGGFNWGEGQRVGAEQDQEN